MHSTDFGNIELDSGCLLFFCFLFLFLTLTFSPRAKAYVNFICATLWYKGMGKRHKYKNKQN